MGDGTSENTIQKIRRLRDENARLREACNHSEAQAVDLAERLKDAEVALVAIQAWLMFNGPVKDDGTTHPAFVKANNATVAALARARGEPVSS